MIVPCVLQCVAVCCSVLQGVAGCCRVFQGVAVCCRVLQCVAGCCNTHKCGGRSDCDGGYYKERLWADVNMTYMNVHIYEYHVPYMGRESTRRDK